MGRVVDSTPDPVKTGRLAEFSKEAADKLWRLGMIIRASRFATIGWPTLLCMFLLYWQVSKWLVYVVSALAFAGLVVLAIRGDELWRRHVLYRIKAWLRSVWIYRMHWRGIMEDCHVIQKRGKTPVLLNLKSRKHSDVALVKNARGVPAKTWQDNAQVIADACEAQALRVTTVDMKTKDGQQGVDRKPRMLQLTFIVREPLFKEVSPFQHPEEAFPQDGWSLSLMDDLQPWKIDPQWKHFAFIGVTGSGKSSGGWAYVDAAQQGIQQRLVRFTGLDPKGGAELGMGEHVFAKFIYGDLKNDPSRYEWPFVEALEEKVQLLNRRLDVMRGDSRKHIATPGDPMEVIFCDEMASLTAWCQNREAKRRMSAAMSHIISKGRAANVLFLGMSQEATKDILPMRDLIPYRVGFRLRTRDQVRMVLGDGMWYKGALCDEIPDILPGIAYAVKEGRSEPFRMRFPYISDDRIRNMLPCPEKQTLHPGGAPRPFDGDVVSGPVLDPMVQLNGSRLSVPARLQTGGLM